MIMEFQSKHINDKTDYLLIRLRQNEPFILQMKYLLPWTDSGLLTEVITCSADIKGWALLEF